MKSLLMTVAVVGTAVQYSSAKLVKQEMLDDFTFANQLAYNLYNGMVRGLYHEHTHKIVDEKCFGDWIKDDMTHLDSVMSKFFNFEFPIPYEEAIKAATETVNLFYMNQRYCSTYKVWEDLNAACPGNDLLNCFADVDHLVDNAKRNMIPIFTRGQNIFQLMLKDDIETDEEILSAIDRLGEDYGALISYILGFDKKFEAGKTH